MNQAYLIMGSNIDPELNIPRSLNQLIDHPDLNIEKTSSVWQTRPVGSRTEDFLNLAVFLTTVLDESSLKEDVLCKIENRMGRVRSENKFAPRPIDLDIIIFNGKVLDDNLFRYDYLILPFAEILPDLVAPVQELPLKVLAATIKPFSTAKIIKLDIPPLI